MSSDRSEILLTGSAPGIDLLSSLCVGQSDILFRSAVRNPGVTFDSQLALKEQVNKLCQFAYLEIRRIGSIRQYFSSESTTTVFPLLFSPGLIIVMLSFPALLRFSLILLLLSTIIMSHDDILLDSDLFYSLGIASISEKNISGSLNCFMKQLSEAVRT